MELRSLPVVTRSNAMPRCPSEFVHPPAEKTFYSISPFFSSASSSFPSDSSACWGEKEESHFSLPCVPRSPSFSQNFREVDNVSGFYLSDLFNSLTILVFIIIIPRVILVRKRANFDGMLEKKGREREKSLGKRITLRVSVHVSKAAEIFRVLDSQYGSHFPQYRRFVR